MKLFLCAVVCSVALLALGCSNGSDNSDSTPQAGTPEVRPTPDALPTVNGNSVISTAKDYSVTFPQDWNPRFNLVSSPTQRADSYFAPEAAGLTINTNITIVCDSDNGAVPADFVQRKLAVVEQLTGSAPTTVPVTVAGRPGERADYTQTSSAANLTIAKSDVYVVGDKCGYTITLTSDPSKRDEYQDEYQSMLDSFAILP